MGSATERPPGGDTSLSETAAGRLWRRVRRIGRGARGQVGSPETLARAETCWSAAGAESAEAGDTLGVWPPPGVDAVDNLPLRTFLFPGQAEDLDEPADYELVQHLGVGGMGEVWRARQPAVGHGVAVKLPKRADDPTALPRFAAEARITRWLRHPGVVSVLELARVGGREGDGRVFYAMPENVGAVWRETLPANPQARNLDILEQLADTLAHAHARGIVHRDLKPDNVLLGEHGEVRLGDWGAAAALAEGGVAPGLSPGNAFAGTPRYMAPEQAAADWRRIGVATDVYLLGAVLLEILTGRPPHANPGPVSDAGASAVARGGAGLGADGRTVETLRRALRNDLPKLRGRSPLPRVAKKALATRPEDRYPGADAFAAALRKARQSSRGSVAARHTLRGVGMLAKVALIVLLLMFAVRVMVICLEDRVTPLQVFQELGRRAVRKVGSLWPASKPAPAVPAAPADPTAHWPKDYAALMARYGRRGSLMIATAGGGPPDSAGFLAVDPEAGEVLAAWEKEGDLRRKDYVQRLRPSRPDEAVLLYLLSDTWEEKAGRVWEPERVRRDMAAHYAERPPARVLYAEFTNTPPERSPDGVIVAATVYFGEAGGYGRKEVEFTLRKEDDATFRVDWERLTARYAADPPL